MRRWAAARHRLAALASALLPERLGASGLALLVTGTSVARLLASVMFGALWTWLGIEAAVARFCPGAHCDPLRGGGQLPPLQGVCDGWGRSVG